MKIHGKMIFPEIKTKLFYPQCFAPSEDRREVEAELPVLSLKTLAFLTSNKEISVATSLK